jgi:hypothetical protein
MSDVQLEENRSSPQVNLRRTLQGEQKSEEAERRLVGVLGSFDQQDKQDFETTAVQVLPRL